MKAFRSFAFAATLTAIFATVACSSSKAGSGNASSGGPSGSGAGGAPNCPSARATP